MSGTNGVTEQVSKEKFKDSFGTLSESILAEWPAIDAEALKATDGELDDVVQLVATSTEHTKALVRRHLGELLTLADSPPPEARTKSRTNELLEKWEKRTAELAKELRQTVLVNARDKVKENALISILVALGLGLVIGFLFGGTRRGRS